MKDTGNNLSADLWPHVQAHPVLAALWMSLEKVRTEDGATWTKIEDAYAEAYKADQAAAALRGMPDPGAHDSGEDVVLGELMSILRGAPGYGSAGDDQDKMIWLNGQVGSTHGGVSVGVGTHYL